MEKCSREIPGLFYLLSGALVFIHSQKTQKQKMYLCFLLAFCSAGRHHKTDFPPLMSAFALTLILYRKKNREKYREKYVVRDPWWSDTFLSWLWVQFSGDSLSTMLAIYSNPHNVESAARSWSISSVCYGVAPIYMFALFIYLARFYSQTLENKNGNHFH